MENREDLIKRQNSLIILVLECENNEKKILYISENVQKMIIHQHPIWWFPAHKADIPTKICVVKNLVRIMKYDKPSAFLSIVKCLHVSITAVILPSF